MQLYDNTEQDIEPDEGRNPSSRVSHGVIVESSDRRELGWSTFGADGGGFRRVGSFYSPDIKITMITRISFSSLPEPAPEPPTHAFSISDRLKHKTTPQQRPKVGSASQGDWTCSRGVRWDRAELKSPPGATVRPSTTLVNKALKRVECPGGCED